LGHASCNRCVPGEIDHPGVGLEIEENLCEQTVIKQVVEMAKHRQAVVRCGLSLDFRARVVPAVAEHLVEDAAPVVGAAEFNLLEHLPELCFESRLGVKHFVDAMGKRFRYAVVDFLHYSLG
jgi:hypothetical protein